MILFFFDLFYGILGAWFHFYFKNKYPFIHDNRKVNPAFPLLVMSSGLIVKPSAAKNE